MSHEVNWLCNNFLARDAVYVAPAYIAASIKNPTAILNRCATHPSEKLIASCSTVAKIANADCVRPMK